jgi:hypothetical protein
MLIRRYLTLFEVGYVIILILASTVTANGELFDKGSTDPLPSWNDGLIKEAIISFVANTTNESNPNYS